MGGRRAGSLKSIVGAGGDVTAAKRELSSAIGASDPTAIANAAVRLVAASDIGLDAFRYGLKLAPVLAEKASALSKLDARERLEAVRQAWSEVKKREKISATPELDSAVVTAATETFRERDG